jgi:hypothetical protein
MDGRSRYSQVNAVKKMTRFEVSRTQRNSRKLIPAIAAIGGAWGLVVTTASALELGDIRLESALGQPLRASIAYALGPNEQMHNYCIYVRSGPESGGNTAVTGARVSLTDGNIVLTGNAAVTEPLLNVRLAVDCPQSAHYQREYTLMLNPAETLSAPPQLVRIDSLPATPVSTLAPAAAESSVAQFTPVPRPAARPVIDESPINTGTTYRVQVGDSASAIALRVENRDAPLWPSVYALVDANPAAFVGGDLNRLIAGTEIVIPDFSAQVAPATAVEPNIGEPATVDIAIDEPDVARIAAPAGAESASAVNAIETPIVTAVAPVAEPVDTTADLTPEADIDGEDTSPFVGRDFPAEETVGLGLTITGTDELRPGDVVALADDTQRPANTEILPIQDADIPEAPENIPESTATSSTWTWLTWLGGAVLAVILGLLAFGGRLRDKFGSGNAAGVGKPAEDEVDPINEPNGAEDVDFNFDDSAAAAETELDADLDDGSGLNDGADVDVLQDFGFAADVQETSQLDLEISEDMTAEPEAATTEVIAPSQKIDEAPVSDFEDGRSDSNWAMQAEQEEDQEYALEGSSIIEEVNLTVLEQDYEEELTASQALNLKIEKAARDLADHLGDEELAKTREQPTVKMPMEEATTEMPAANRAAGFKTDDRPPAVESKPTANLNANLPTNLDAENDPSAADSGTQQTVEMVAAGSDIAVEMEVESGKVDTKKIEKLR